MHQHYQRLILCIYYAYNSTSDSECYSAGRMIEELCVQYSCTKRCNLMQLLWNISVIHAGVSYSLSVLVLCIRNQSLQFQLFELCTTSASVSSSSLRSSIQLAITRFAYAHRQQLLRFVYYYYTFTTKIGLWLLVGYQETTASALAQPLRNSQIMAVTSTLGIIVRNCLGRSPEAL